jgi:hypothetical protein
MEEINFTPEQEIKPEVFPIDARKCQSLEEMGLLLNALGMAMTKEFAVEQGLEHLLQIEE